MRKLKKEVWPFHTRINQDKDGKGCITIDDWCAENMGRRFDDWFSYNTEDKRLYAFKDEATLLVFKLRWNYNG